MPFGAGGPWGGQSKFGGLTSTIVPIQQAIGTQLAEQPHVDLNREALGFEQRQFDTQQQNRQQLLDLLGFNQQTLGEGGLLGSNFFGSILGNTAPGLVGGITGAIGGGGGQIGQPGFPDSPGGGTGIPNIGGGNGSLFGQLLGGRQQLGADILGDLAGFGDSHRNRINRDFSNLQGSELARLEDRGLGSSTLASAVTRGVERDRQEALGSLEDQLLGQRIGAKTQIGEGIFGDVGQELDRGLERQRLGVGLLGNLLGSAMNIVSI